MQLPLRSPSAILPKALKPRRQFPSVRAHSLCDASQLRAHGALDACQPTLGADVFADNCSALLTTVAGRHAIFRGQARPAPAAIALPRAVRVRHGLHALDESLRCAGHCFFDEAQHLQANLLEHCSVSQAKLVER